MLPADPYALDPAHRRPVAVVGCGGIVRAAHLPAYAKHGVPVRGVYDPEPKATARVGVPVYKSLDDLLADPEVAIVDVATHVAVRAPLVRQALEAGKHVLSQKPLAGSLAEARDLLRTAERTGRTLAVNQNGRFSPPFYAAMQAIQRGEIGPVRRIEHRFEVNYGWIVGTPFDAIPHWALYDYAVHWFDITRCWFEGQDAVEVAAREWRPAGQDGGQQPWAFHVEARYERGEATFSTSGDWPGDPAHRFRIEGEQGVIEGSNLGGESVRVNGEDRLFPGQWFPDGFFGAYAELCRALAEARVPWNSAAHNLPSLSLTLAACESAEQNGEPTLVKT